MTFETFYCCYGSGVEVSSTKPRTMEHRDLYVFAFEILEEPDDFFGIVDHVGTTFQIMVEPNDVFWCEVPDTAHKGSHGARLNFDQLVDVLKQLPSTFTASMIPGASFDAW